MMHQPHTQTPRGPAGGVVGPPCTQPTGPRTTQGKGTRNTRAGRLRRAAVLAVGVLALGLTLAACDRPLDANSSCQDFLRAPISNPGFGRQGRGARLAPPGCGKSFGTAECRVSVRQLSGSHARKRSTTQRELTLGSNPPPTRRWRSTVGGEWLGTAATPGMTEPSDIPEFSDPAHPPLGGSLRTRGMDIGTRPLE